MCFSCGWGCSSLPGRPHGYSDLLSNDSSGFYQDRGEGRNGLFLAWRGEREHEGGGWKAMLTAERTQVLLLSGTEATDAQQGPSREGRMCVGGWLPPIPWLWGLKLCPEVMATMTMAGGYLLPSPSCCRLMSVPWM